MTQMNAWGVVGLTVKMANKRKFGIQTNTDDPNQLCRGFKNQTYPVFIFSSPSGKANVPAGDA